MAYGGKMAKDRLYRCIVVENGSQESGMGMMGRNGEVWFCY